MSSATISTARAVVVKRFGGYNVLSVQQNPLPPLGDKIEVKVEFGGLNFADLYTRQGLIATKRLPFVLGIECTGTITAIGSPENCNFTLGQRVICYDYNSGMHAEIVRVPKEKVYPLPDDVNFQEGTTIFVNYLTAYFSLFEVGNLKKNDSVLILSGAGGTGWAATQLAKTIEGVKVYGVASSKCKEKWMKDNGADVTMCYDSLKNNLRALCPNGFDLIISNQAGPSFTYLQNQLRPLGRIVLIGANNIIRNERKLSFFALLKAWWTTKHISPESLVNNSRSVAGLHLGFVTEKSRDKINAALEHIFRLMSEGVVKPKIHSVLPMTSIVEATKMLAERKNVGKVLISMQE